MASTGKLPESHRLDIDFLKPGPFSADERERFANWYATFHGEGDLDRARFVHFWLEHRDEVLKHYRRWVEAALTGTATTSVGALAFLHTYTVMGWGSGAQYEIISARKCGVTKSQVLDVMALAFIHAGPKGTSDVAALCNDYLHKWPDDEVAKPEWPVGWDFDNKVFASGIDLQAKGMSPAELEKLKHWYVENQGEVPNFVNFLGEWSPDGLKALRNRYERSVGTLPRQLVPLLMFHTAAIQGEIAAMRRSAFQARRYGVTRGQILPVLQRAIAYTGEIGTDKIVEALSGLFAHWED